MFLGACFWPYPRSPHCPWVLPNPVLVVLQEGSLRAVRLVVFANLHAGYIRLIGKSKVTRKVEETLEEPASPVSLRM